MGAPLLLDLTHTSHTRARTGIQRVARSLRAALGPGAVPVTFDPYRRAWRTLEAWELANLEPGEPAAKRGARWPLPARLRGTARRLLAGAPRCGVPANTAGLVVPEVFSPAVAAALPALFAATSGPRVAVFHDAIALKLPELTPAKTVARFPAYLRELLAFDAIAAISDESRESLLAYWRWLGVTDAPPVRTIPLGIDRVYGFADAAQGHLTPIQDDNGPAMPHTENSRLTGDPAFAQGYGGQADSPYPRKAAPIEVGRGVPAEPDSGTADRRGARIRQAQRPEPVEGETPPYSSESGQPCRAGSPHPAGIENPQAGLPGDRGGPVVLSIGSLEGRKNHVALLDACEALWVRGIRFELHLIGLAHPETGRAALERVRGLQAAGRPVRYDGPATDAAVDHAYAGCAFTVYPSLMEGFGLPVLESLAHGKPCVCSSRGALGESARGGGCVAVERVDAATLAGAIERLLTRPGELGRLTEATRSRTFRAWAAYVAELTGWMGELRGRAKNSRDERG